jgi:hypothetical protein
MTLKSLGLKMHQILYVGSKDEYITYCTPEATAAIDSYLSHRGRTGERLGDNSPLFRTDFYANDLFKVRNDIKPMTIDAITKAIQNALRKSDLLSTCQVIRVARSL